MTPPVRQLASLRRFRPLAREMGWVVLGQCMAAVGGLVGVRVITELLSPERYGELALGITLVTLGQLLAWSPISGVVLRYFSAAQESLQLGAYLDAVRRLLVHATTALVGLGGVVVLALFGLEETRWIGLALAALLFTLASGYEAVLDSMQLAGRRRSLVAWHQGASMWLRFLVAVALISLFGPSSGLAMLGYAVGVLFVLVSQLYFFQRRVLTLRERRFPSSVGDSTALARRMTQYAWPIAAWGAFSWIQTVSDRWVLQGFTTTAVVGLYTAVYQLGFYPMNLFSLASLQFASPVLFERAGDGSDPQRMHGVLRVVAVIVGFTIAFTAIATLTTWVLHGEIFGLLVGARYREASYLLPWMVCAGGLFAAGQAASQAMLVGGLTKRLVVPKGVIALITLGFYTVGATLWGLDGVIYGNVAFGVLYFGWMLYLAMRWRADVLNRVRAPSPGGSVA